MIPSNTQKSLYQYEKNVSIDCYLGKLYADKSEMMF